MSTEAPFNVAVIEGSGCPLRTFTRGSLRYSALSRGSQYWRALSPSRFSE